MDKLADIEIMQDERDESGLIQELRGASDSEIRAKAAEALGKIGDLNSTESLIRAYLQDPALVVQTAAYQALEDLVGNEAQATISAYLLPDDPWLVEVPAESDEVVWDEHDLEGLIATVRFDNDIQKQRKALDALSHIESTRAVEILASNALWSDEPQLRQAARDALYNVYGDNLEEILQSYRDANPDEEPKDQEPADLTDPAFPQSSTPASPSTNNSHSTMLNDIFYGVIILFLLLLAVYLYTH